MTLQSLAVESGGESNDNVKNFANAISKIVEDSSNLYSLSFDSTPLTTSDEHRSIDLKVGREDVTVRTTSSYYAQP